MISAIADKVAKLDKSLKIQEEVSHLFKIWVTFFESVLWMCTITGTYGPSFWNADS